MASASEKAGVHIFGIRHHGPGSARSLRRALEELQPDVILVEGPPDAAEVLPLAIEQDMEPPVALLLYRPDQPQRAVYYPFAVFSPEWQAMQYGLRLGVPVRFMDLPQAHQLLDLPAEPPVEVQPPPAQPDPNETEPAELDPEELIQNLKLKIQNSDPLGWLAEAAGYSDSERWWEHMVEQRQDSTDVFAAILEAMTALREAKSLGAAENQREAQREAFMRQTIRQAQREGFQKIAIVCGAWHGPALTNLAEAKADAELLKGLPKVNIAATWIPWTYGRLAFASGYGAGIESPGWYQHLWDNPNQTAIRWLTSVARLLREEDIDTSTAHVIEAVRLAEALAVVRNRPVPGLPEFNEAVMSVICQGNDAPLKLIHRKLIVGERLGQVPGNAPTVALQQDLTREQKRLRLAPEAFQSQLDLDLRKPTDLERSQLLHRLNLLGIGWGKTERVSGKSGTFHELWKLQWQPEFTVALIEKAVWGNTVLDAASAYVQDEANRAENLPALSALLDRTLLAEVPAAVSYLMTRIENEAALANDIAHLMEALPALANVLRYGNVRQVNRGLIGQIVDGLVARICVGLPPACVSLNDEAAQAMQGRLNKVNEAILLIQDEEMTFLWQITLKQLADQKGLHGLLAGRGCRILLDAGIFTVEEAARRLGLALSPGTDPLQAADWVDGFVRGSSALLLHGDRLWQVLDEWVTSLPKDSFDLLLPLLRRTFATFSRPERRQMGERVRRGPARTVVTADIILEENFDAARATAALELIGQLLGVRDQESGVSDVEVGVRVGG